MSVMCPVARPTITRATVGWHGPRLRLVGSVPADLGHAGFEELVALALDGHRGAWEVLVERLQRVAWHAIGGFDLSPEDRKDAFAATFFRLYERLGTVREPAKLPGWVATTARNEVLTLLRARRRDLPVDLDDDAVPPLRDEPAAGLIEQERLHAVHAGLARLSGPCQQLLRLLTVDPPLSYAEISDVLDIPQGSLGPTRQRCLERLRATPELLPFLSEATS